MMLETLINSKTNSFLSSFALATIFFLAACVSAEDLLIVTLSCDSNGDRTVTIEATEALSEVDAIGSTQTGFYLAHIYNAGGIFVEQTATGDLTSANNQSDGSPSLFRINTNLGLNVYNYSAQPTSSFTSGEIAFSGFLSDDLTATRYEDLLEGNREGNIYFPADSDDDIPNAQLIGTYRVVVDDVLFGDANQDQEVNLLDIPAFVDELFGTSCEADINQNGEVNFSDIPPFIEILNTVPRANFAVAPMGMTGDFFWSTAGLGEGAVNTELDLDLSVGQTATLFLYYTTNGPVDSNLQTGASINVATSTAGVVAFNSAETFDFPITIDGTILNHRWNDNNDRGYFGPANEVTDELIIGLTAFTVTAGPGIDEFNMGNPFLDEGYDPAADAYLFGTVDLTTMSPGKITLLPGFNGLGIVDSDQFLAAQFANATINVMSDVLLGDMNCDGEISLLDVAPFVLALSDPVAYEAAFPDCVIFLGDLNQDGAVNLLDVGPFVDLLAGP